ncbi:RHS repeat-associated core domain-containing protein [Niastella caeni]|nr:RHS repeat-associated core domain-containing protein [Niastella caeni]
MRNIVNRFISATIWPVLLMAGILLGSNQPLWASGGPGIEDAPLVAKLTGTSLVQNATATTSFASGTQSGYTIKNIISLRVVEEAPSYIPADFTATVKVKIEYGHSSSSLNTIAQQDLQVTYTRAMGAPYNAIRYFHFDGAEYVKITVLEVTPATVGSINIGNLLLLQNELRATRYYNLGTNVQPATFSTTAPTGGADELAVSWSWPANTGHTHTQLEWTWQENGLDSLHFVNGALNTALMFKRNATRIDLPAGITTYKIPLLYSGKGRLYCRIRAVNIKGNGSRSDGPWSPPQSQSFDGHNEFLNWQSTTSFSEEGKRKTIVQYFDGSLRNRQTVSKDNVTNTTITAETFYDEQGRPAVQVLPVPGISTVIAYAKNLNRFNVQALNEDPAKYFDLQPIGTTGSTTPELNTESGAANYYSAANAELNTGVNKHIPDAEGYPYSVTRYMPDGTGRIMAQSGVGAALKMGSGRETKYYYGTPAQEELDGLFGTEVGNHAHYFKNMVKDANGQMSISYVDMHGRTIATALAGDAPANMQALSLTAADYPNQAGTPITRNLLNDNTNTVKNNSLESINSLLVPATTAYTFRYALTPQALQLTSCTNTAICYDCLYNLEIAIIDESGDLAPVVRKFNNISVAPDDSCNTAIASFTNDTTGAVNNLVQFSQTLLPGSYVIRKTLTISESSLQYYKDLYITKGLCKTEQQLVDSIKTVLINVSGCNNPPPANTCQACLDELGTYDNYRSTYLATIGNPNPVTAAIESEVRSLYDNTKAYCNQLCGTTSQLMPTKRSMMLADMVPFSGQYARDTGSGSMYLKYNIFITDGTETRPFYQKPWNSSKLLDFYRNSYDVIDPAIHPDNTLTKLQTLSSADFSQQFVNAWANALLPHHPEYDRLVFAETQLADSYNWINTFSNTGTYDMAAANGFIFTSSANITDPFYTLSPFYKAEMVTKITSNYRNGFSLWQLAYGNVFCKEIVHPVERENCYRTVQTTHPVSSLSFSQKNEVWAMFRDLYAAVRDSQVNAYIAANVPLSDGSFLVQQGYKLHFPTNYNQMAEQGGSDWSWYPATPDATPDLTKIPGGVAISNVYASRCSSYIQQWRRNLLQCDVLAARADKEAILNQITAAMNTICLKATNESHPYGASNVPPDAPVDGTPRSFEQVIYNIFKTYNIDTSNLCNPYVIEFPKPYAYNAPRNENFITAFDSCHCSRLSRLQSEATAAGSNGSTLQGLNSYLKQTYNDTITVDLYNSMAANCASIGKTVCTDTVVTKAYSCTDTIPCNCTRFNIINTCYIKCRQNVCWKITSFPLNVSQPLPAFLECGFVASSNCLTCAQLSNLVAEFKVQSGSPYNAGPVFTGSDLTPANIRDNIYFQKFLNYRTGYQYNWMDYVQLAVAAGCNLANYAGNTNATQTVVCGSTTLPSDTAGLRLTEPPCERVTSMAIAWAHEIYIARKAALLAGFEEMYRAKCMAAKSIEQFTVDYSTKEYHYTLYYYDMAGNLVKTVPPKGARPRFNTGFIDSVRNARATNTSLVPLHVLATDYRYNSLGSIVAQKSPDAGTASFWYDRLGRLAVSRNAQQAVEGKYSYTMYDALGRITEVGQKPQTTAMTQTISQDAAALFAWINTNGGTKEQITFTAYDVAYPPLLATYITQQNLRNRVSYMGIKNLGTDADHYTATFYTYDVHGNVDTLLQDYKGIAEMNSNDNRFKLIAYDYDLVSGKVNSVGYQPGRVDAFYHRYSYDAENRLTTVESSRDKIVWERDAAYNYYKHGPLARTELGQLRVQGLDYAFTLQGWVKGMNSTGVGAGVFDIGKDGYTGGTNSVVARDVLGYALHYYDNNGTETDYKPIGGTTAFARPGTAAGLSSLYNGNIGAISINNRALAKGGAATNSLPLLYNYRYDQLNRMVSMQAYKGFDSVNNTWNAVAINDYKEAVTYDPNGNIKTYNRKGAPGIGKPLEMDALTYNYNANTNQLNYVQDTVTATNYAEDIDGQSGNNYTYDAIGNLKTDFKEGITGITWNVYGKMTGLVKNGSTISYTYDAAGNRITKSAGSTTTIYVRDASGNVMSVYEKPSAGTLQQAELHLYGSSRLGLITKQTVAPATVSLATGFGAASISVFTRNEKVYELTNHLGNVLATIGDKKLQHTSDNSTVDYYDADVVTATDYYPFGMGMEGRKYANGNKYRYGFNGKEQNNETSSTTTYDYGFRIYTPALGRFLSVDPLTKKYPELTPYQFASNTPIAAIDLDGLEAKISTEKNTYFVVLKNIHFRFIQRQSTEYFTEATKDFPRHDFSINTQMFDFNNYWDYATARTPQPTSDYTPQGQNVAHGAVVSGRSAQQTFHIAHNKDGSWSTGYGNVPKDATFGIGGGTPIVINGLNFGVENVFTDNAPERVKKIGPKGWVDPADWKYLIQKSNGVYAGQNDAIVGKTILGFNSKTNVWIIVSQENGQEGFTLDEIRDRLVGQGYNNVLAFDGSTSSTLVENGKILVSPDTRKNSTIPSGLNFSVPYK